MLPTAWLRATLATIAAVVVFGVLTPASAQEDFVTFETGQVRPLALSPDGTRLFAANTPDNRLEIFDVAAESITRVGSVPVGLEPIDRRPLFAPPCDQDEVLIVAEPTW